MRIGKIALTAWSLVFSVNAFSPAGLLKTTNHQPTTTTPTTTTVTYKRQNRPNLLVLKSADNDDDEEKEENPYADPNYPDLEFVNYDDPEYKVDQGVGDEFFDPDSTEAKIEEMREERRSRNDEYQFETYFKEILKKGKEYKGEWTVFETSTFLDGVDGSPLGVPRLKKVAKPLKVISWAERITKEESSGDSLNFASENDRIIHKEKVYSDPDEKKGEQQLELEKSAIASTYWPEEMSPYDFRGKQGIMCVGSSYTLCTAELLSGGASTSNSEGPYSVYRAEIGILSDVLRLRVKLDYAVLEEEKASMDVPPLHLRTMTVCRETLEAWPRADANYKSSMEQKTEIPFYGPAGAPGGLYDPPPVGDEDQATMYMMLDFDGLATLLLPYKMTQDENDFADSLGWVTSLDWTPGQLRFQADRKVGHGKNILGLRTLELTEVQGADADEFRPRDGGSDMRQ